MKNTFISKSDLAQAYFPYIDCRSARHKLMAFLRTDASLMAQLEETGYTRLTHSFSPKQVELIIEYLGDPWR